MENCSVGEVSDWCDERRRVFAARWRTQVLTSWRHSTTVPQSSLECVRCHGVIFM